MVCVCIRDDDVEGGTSNFCSCPVTQVPGALQMRPIESERDDGIMGSERFISLRFRVAAGLVGLYKVELVQAHRASIMRLLHDIFEGEILEASSSDMLSC